MDGGGGVEEAGVNGGGAGAVIVVVAAMVAVDATHLAGGDGGEIRWLDGRLWVWLA